jgi:hypothetical protein
VVAVTVALVAEADTILAMGTVTAARIKTTGNRNSRDNRDGGSRKVREGRGLERQRL